jgi:hypothetical protein
VVTVSSPLSGKTANTPLKMEGLRMEEDFSEEPSMQGVYVA